MAKSPSFMPEKCLSAFVKRKQKPLLSYSDLIAPNHLEEWWSNKMQKSKD